jgi:succinoglycan biosynthesis transport protein ExoP
MENDQRLTPLPGLRTIQPNTQIDYSPTGGYAAGYDDTPGGKRSLRQYFQIVYKRLPIIVAITILATAAAAIYSYRQPTLYATETAVIIEPKKAPQSQQNVTIVNNGDDTRYYMTQLELLRSPDLMKRVIVSLGLHREKNLFAEQNRGLLAGLPSLFSGEQKPTESPNTLPVLSDTSITEDDKVKVELTPEEDARATAYSYKFTVQAVPKQQTNIVTVSVTTTNQALAPKVADKIATLFIEENQEREIGQTKQALKELDESIAGLRTTIAQQQDQYISQMRSSALGLGDKQGELRAGNLEGLLTMWREAQKKVAEAEAKYNTAQRAKGTPAILSIDESQRTSKLFEESLKAQADMRKRIEEIDKKIDEAEEKRKELLATKTEQHRDVLSKNEQLKELKDQKARIEKEVATKIKTDRENLEKDTEKGVLVNYEAQLNAARLQESKARAVFENAAGRANAEGIDEVRLSTLDSALKSNQTLLDTYTKRQKELELALSMDRPNNITQQAPAGPAGQIGPQRGRNIMVALFLSLAAGIGLAFLLDFLDDSVRTSDDISRHLGLPTLALIPHTAAGDKKKLLGSATGNGAGGGGPGTSLITLDERTSPTAEAYRHLRTSLLFSSAGKPPQTILVTSSQPSEGKTTTAINTAITLAQGDADVVIIDCDLRRPRLHTHFGLENTRGLTNYLSGDRETEGLIRTYPDLPKLKVITSGPIPPNPAELLSSNEMRNLLTFLSGKFKHVIIDSPPAISFTDASILSTLVDGVVLVAMANKSSLHLMKQFKQRISAIGARIYGVVLNGIKANSTEYYYYGSGYYNYYNRPADDESTPMLEDVQK